MTIYEFFVESVTADIRLEVPPPGLFGSGDLLNRLNALCEQGAGRRLDTNWGELAVDLTVDDVRQFLEGVDKIYVGRPRLPDPGPLRPTHATLDALAPETLFTVVFYEI